MKIKRKPAIDADVPDFRTHEVFPREWADAPYLIAIDPGLQGTGVAVWHLGKLVEARVIDVPSKLRGLPWTERAEFIATAIEQSLFARIGLQYRAAEFTVVCEFMEGFGGAKMMAWKTGDMQRTVYLIGLISGRIWPARFVPVNVGTWKGQLPKHIVEERLRRRMGPALVKKLDPQLHAWDAIGIGMWARGEF